MLFSLLTVGTAAAAFFGSASAQGCDEAERFGIVTFPNPMVLGEPTVFNANFACAAQDFGVPAVFSDYILKATADPTNPGLLGPIPTVYFARRVVPTNQIDSFNVTFGPGVLRKCPWG